MQSQDAFALRAHRRAHANKICAGECRPRDRLSRRENSPAPSESRGVSNFSRQRLALFGQFARERTLSLLARLALCALSVVYWRLLARWSRQGCRQPSPALSSGPFTFYIPLVAPRELAESLPQRGKISPASTGWRTNPANYEIRARVCW